MTFDDDFIQLVVDGVGVVRFPCAPAGIAWPPPDLIMFNDVMYRQVRRSAITDEQRAELTMIARGAEYVVDHYPMETRH